MPVFHDAVRHLSKEETDRQEREQLLDYKMTLNCTHRDEQPGKINYRRN